MMPRESAMAGAEGEGNVQLRSTHITFHGPHPLHFYEAGAASAASKIAGDNAVRIGELKAKMEALEKSARELEDANKRLRLENAEYKSKVEQLNLRISALKSSMDVELQQREHSEKNFSEQIASLTAKATSSDEKRQKLEKENITLVQANKDLRATVAKLQSTVAQLEGDLEAEKEARGEADKRFQEQLTVAQGTAEKALSNISVLEATVQRLHVSDEELTRKNFAIGVRTFGSDTYTAVMNYIWPGCDDAIGGLREMIHAVHTLTNGGRVQDPTQQWVSKAGTRVQRRLSLLGVLGVHSVVYGRTVLSMHFHRHAGQYRVG
jgi:DNA repair exonuclease SbcCD ATPase subunit